MVSVFLMKSVCVNWGGFSQITAELTLLRYGIKHHIKFDYFHLISGHDYPCVSNEKFDNFFNNVPKGRSFMHFDTEEQHIKWKHKIDSRVNKWYLNDMTNCRLCKLLLTKVLNIFVPRKFETELYAGWNWFSWHRSLVKWVLLYLNNNKNYLKRFHYTSVVKKSYFIHYCMLI